MITKEEQQVVIKMSTPSTENKDIKDPFKVEGKRERGTTGITNNGDDDSFSNSEDIFQPGQRGRTTEGGV